ncbi:hypothetical protein [Nonomuraea zeae]|uniref:hypothetical protein n=1 Tax=Nonomuraea zeae TaxID=1642303 RepID=UPI00361B0543
MLAAGCAITIGAWIAYAIATAPLPKAEAFSGAITAYFPEQVQDARIEVSIGAHIGVDGRFWWVDSLEDDYIRIDARGPKSGDPCIPYFITAYGDAKPRDPAESYFDLSKLKILSSPYTDDPYTAGQRMYGQLCRDYGSLELPPLTNFNYTSQISYNGFAGQTVKLNISSGARLFRAPAINGLLLPAPDKQFRAPDEYRWTVDPFITGMPVTECVTRIATEVLATHKLENAQPAFGEKTLEWSGCGEEAKQALYIDLQKEKDNNRLLFWSGALLGLAFSLFVAGLEFLINHFRGRE